MREFEAMAEGGRRRGGGGIARTLTHFGMAAATLAFASWWTTNTVFDSTRTTRIATAVLASAPLRAHVADAIAPIAAEAVPALLSGSGAAAGQPAPTTTDQLALRLEGTLGRPDIQAALVAFVGQLHDRVIGVASGPAVLDPSAVHDLVAAASPATTPEELAKIPAVSIDVPNLRPMSASSRALRLRWPWYVAAAAVLLVAAVAFSRDRRETVKLIGRWLVGISVGHLVVLYVLPVYVVPRVTKNPWVALVASIAREVGAGLVVGLAAVALAGVLCLLVDRLLPASGAEPAADPR